MARQARPLVIVACIVCIALVYALLPGNSIAADAARAGLSALAAVVSLIALRRLEPDGARAQEPLGRRRLGAIAILVLFAAIAGAAVITLQGQASDAPPIDEGQARGTGSPAAIVCLGVIALSCVATALWEEGAFRVMLPELFERALQGASRPSWAAILASALIFAILHAGTTARGDIASVGLRIAQAFCFALAMSALVGGRAGLAKAVGAHAAYDLVAFIIPLEAGGGASRLAISLSQPAAGLFATATAQSIAATLVFLVPAALIGCMLLWKRETNARETSDLGQ